MICPKSMPDAKYFRNDCRGLAEGQQGVLARGGRGTYVRDHRTRRRYTWNQQYHDGILRRTLANAEKKCLAFGDGQLPWELVSSGY